MIRLSHVKFQSAVPVSSEVLRGAGRCLPLPQSVSLFPPTMRGSEKAKQRDTLGGFPMPSETPLLTKFLHPLEGLFSAKERTEFYTLEPMDSFRNSERTTATAWARTISEVDLETALFDEASFFKQLHGHMLRFPYVVFPHFAQILLQSRTSPSALSKLPGQIPPDWATLSPADAAFKLQVWISRGLAKQIGGKIQERPGYWSNNLSADPTSVQYLDTARWPIGDTKEVSATGIGHGWHIDSMAAAVPPQFSSFLAESVLPGYKTSYVRSKDVIAKLDREKWERIWTLQTGRLVGCRNEGNKSSAGRDGVPQPVLAVHPSSGEPTLCYNQAPPRVGKMQLVGDGDGEDEMVNVSIDPSLPRAEKEQQLQRRVEALKEDPETQRRLDDQTSSLHEEMNDAIRRTGDVMHNEWGKGDLVLIDNLALLHTANPSLQAHLHSQMVERGERLPVRLLQRTTMCAGKEAQEKGLESLRRSDRRSIKTRV